MIGTLRRILEKDPEASKVLMRFKFIMPNFVKHLNHNEINFDTVEKIKTGSFVEYNRTRAY